MKARHIRFWCVTILCLAALFVGIRLYSTSAVPTAGAASSSVPTASTPVPSPTPEPQPQVSTVTLSASGDNLIHEGIYYQAAARAQANGSDAAYDFSACYEALRDFYAGFDINWINQETLVNDVCEPAAYPCFSTPGQMAWDLYDLGFRVFSLSNNHSYDKGAVGLQATRALWATLPEDTITAGLYSTDGYGDLAYQTVNGITIAYLSYTQHTNGIATPADADHRVIYLNETDAPIIEAQMAEAAEHADFVVVSCHWGVEGSHTVTEEQQEWAQRLADLGADLIIGTHPHVIQDGAWLTAQDGRSVFVAYSLGNFLNMQASPDNMIGSILSVTLEKTEYPDGTFEFSVKSPSFTPVINHYEAHFASCRLYLLQDYTEELAQSHGVRGAYPEFGLSYIQQVLQDTISSEWLA